MTESYDVIVVGAGPAGSTCAAFLARAGRRVLVVDEAAFPREKVCGDAISRTKASAILRELGLERDVDLVPGVRTCGSLRLHAPNGACVDLGDGSADASRPQNRLIPRRAFDAFLVSRLAPSVAVREGFLVTGLLREGKRTIGVIGRAVRGGAPEPIRSHVVVGADGVHSVVAKHAGLHPGDRRRIGIAIRGYVDGVAELTDRLELYFLTRLLPGYLWIFPSGGGTANVGLGLFRADLDRLHVGLTDLFWQSLHGHPELDQRFRDAKMCGSPAGWPLPLWHRRTRLSADGVLLVGDAAWLIDPATGEGIGNAMLSGKLAASVIIDALHGGDVSAAFIRRYDTRLWHCLGLELQLAHVFQRLLCHRWLVDGVLSLAQANRLVWRLLHDLIEAPEGKRSLLSAGGVQGLLHSLGTADEVSP